MTTKENSGNRVFDTFLSTKSMKRPSRNKTSRLVRAVANTAGAMGAIAAVNYATRAEGGTVVVDNLDREGLYNGCTAYFKNHAGGEEGLDFNDWLYFSGSHLEVYSMEPGFKASLDVKPTDTFGWLFNLAALEDVTGADNYLRIRVSDPADIPGLVAYDLADPSVQYDIPLDGSICEIDLDCSEIPAGEYAYWRMDIVPEPSIGILASVGLIGALVGKKVLDWFKGN